jgi:exonuclease SbcC
MDVLMDLGWYTIQESFKAQWKGTQNKSKIIQENLDTQNAAFHLLELPFKSWKTVLDGKQHFRLKIAQQPQLKRSC